jgi:hypothetical protein
MGKRRKKKKGHGGRFPGSDKNWLDIGKGKPRYIEYRAMQLVRRTRQLVD